MNYYASPGEARIGLARFFDKYSNCRPHQSLKYLTPAELYYGNYTLKRF
jgi:transposase InsO family protein